MAIEPHILNQQVLMHPALPLKVGVYLNHKRATAIVVRVKEGKVTYLTMANGSIEMIKQSREVFLDGRGGGFELWLPNYPVRRALRGYIKDNLRISADAAKVIQLVLAQ